MVGRACERCKKDGNDVKDRPSRTAYAPKHLNSWQRLLLDEEGLGEPEDPNSDLLLCDECAEDYDAYMDEMWSYAHSQ